MKILKPNWVNHDDLPIFSIDVHPDGSRFATGGQGKDSGAIVIWNMGPVVDKEKENDENAPKILCRMDHHIACVNVVRWSNNGLFLASGSDDKLIMIWQFVHGGGYENIENWKCGFTLRGHSGDVLDLSWSSKDQYLASCSVDNTVIIWNALKFPDIICRINAHAGLVKGVAWDPVGNYFASQSDDKTLKIWKTLDWALEKCIDEPFKQCTGTTHVLRLNWSPDGQLVISAHAINNGAPTAQVIERGNKWNAKLDFVGHRKAVTSVRFFPLILKPFETTDSSTDFKTHCLCALGSRDRSISIWLTNYSRPLCAVHDLFDNPIMDLSWSRHPSPGLMACSMDGSVAYVEFAYEEIGKPLTKEETERFFMKKYNYDINAAIPIKSQQLNNQSKPGQFGLKKLDSSVKLIENLDVLLAQEQQKLKQENEKNKLNNDNNNNNNNSFNNSLNTSSSNTASNLPDSNKQIERRLPDGRRRITPICISKPGEFDIPKPFTSLSASFNKIGFASSIGFESINSRTATEQSTIIVEKRDEKNEIIEISPVKSIIYSKPNFQNSNSNDKFINIVQNNNNNNNKLLTNVNGNVISNTIEPNISEKMDTTENNIQIPITNVPLVISKPTEKNINNDTQQQQQQQQTIHPTARKQLIKDEKNLVSNTHNNTNKSSKNSSASNSNNKNNNHLNSPLQQNSKQKVPVVVPINKTTTTTASTSDNLSNIVTVSASPQKNLNLTKDNVNNNHDHDGHHNHHQHHHSHHKSSHTYLNPLKIDEKFTTRNIRLANNTITTIEILNSLNILDGNNQRPSSINTNTNNNENDYNLINQLKYIENKILKWQIYLHSRICDVAFGANSELVSVCCEDATLNLYKTKSGSQLCCPIQLDSKASVLKVNLNYCMCITQLGNVYVWKHENKNNNDNEIVTIINKQSCENVLRDSKLYGEYSSSTLTDTGIPIITMSKNNKSYFFSLQSQCWHVIPAIGQINNVFSNNSSLKMDEINNGPLNLVQMRTKSSMIVKTIDLINKSSSSQINKEDFTLTHLESQMNAALGLNSAKEYKFWLMTYVRYLVENNYEEKLTEQCNFLLGPLYSINWQDKILTHKKRDLLQDVLNIVVQDLKFQRLYNFFKQQLNYLNNVSNNINNNSNKKSSILDRLSNNNNNNHISNSFQSIANNSTNNSVSFNINECLKDKLDARTSTATPPLQPIIDSTFTQINDDNKQVDQNLEQEVEMTVIAEENNLVSTSVTPNQIIETVLVASDQIESSSSSLSSVASSCVSTNQEINLISETNHISKNTDSEGLLFKVPQDPCLFKNQSESSSQNEIIIPGISLNQTATIAENLNNSNFKIEEQINNKIQEEELELKINEENIKEEIIQDIY